MAAVLLDNTLGYIFELDIWRKNNLERQCWAKLVSIEFESLRVAWALSVTVTGITKAPCTNKRKFGVTHSGISFLNLSFYVHSLHKSLSGLKFSNKTWWDCTFSHYIFFVSNRKFWPMHIFRRDTIVHIFKSFIFVKQGFTKSCAFQLHYL